MNILIACEISGRVRDAFRRKGHNAWSCDILGLEDIPKPYAECQQFPEFHIKDDCRNVIGSRWDMMIAHPECTFLCNSGVRWLYETGYKRNPIRWEAMKNAAGFFATLLNAPIERIALENPIMHGHGRQLVGRGPTQIIHPWMFGEPESKSTCLWLKGLPRLVPTHHNKYPEQAIFRMGPGPLRSFKRSLTFKGIANAIAEQWG
jgi:hypothetical protein